MMRDSREVGAMTRIGPAAIQSHGVALARRLAAGLDTLGFPVCRPRDPRHQVHVVSLGCLDPDAMPESADWLLRFDAHLERHRVRASWRNGILRFSMHVCNDVSDVDRVLALAEDFLGARVGARPAGVASRDASPH